MHRHGYQGRKLSRDTDQRQALIRGQVTSLVLHERLSTTEAKAKEAAPYFERIVTKAKQGSLHSQRQVRQMLLTENAVAKLYAELVPAFAERTGGYTRITKSGRRLGDNAPMAILSLVLPNKPAKAAKTEVSDEAKPEETKPAAKKPAIKKTAVKSEKK